MLQWWTRRIVLQRLGVGQTDDLQSGLCANLSLQTTAHSRRARA